MAKLDNAEDWWAEVETHWDDIQNLFFNEAGLPQSMTAPALVHRELEIKGEAGSFDKAFAGEEGTVPEVMERYRKAKDRRLYHIFQAFWEDAPDHPKIHGWRYWGGLCDLCSEGAWILFPEEEEATHD